MIGVRAFPKFVDWSLDRQDRVLQGFAKHSPVPVINMETITHPCQELAHVMALQERFGTTDLRGKKYVLTWTYHPRALNTAVANSALTIATRMGLDVTLLCPTPAYVLDERHIGWDARNVAESGGSVRVSPYHPRALNTAVANSALTIATRMGLDVTLLCPTPEYVLDERYMGWDARNVAESGGSLQVSHDIDSAYAGADVVYAKSWGALPYFGNWEAEKPIRDRFKHFIVDEAKMAKTNDGVFSHCLPLRRNVKATDAVMDSPGCIAIDEAENRLHVQKAVMAVLAGAPRAGNEGSRE